MPREEGLRLKDGGGRGGGSRGGALMSPSLSNKRVISSSLSPDSQGEIPVTS